MPVASDEARGRQRTPLGARLRRAGLRRELRRAGGRARAGRLGREGAGARPLRDRRAPDLGLRDADRAGWTRSSWAARMRQTLRRARRAHAVPDLRAGRCRGRSRRSTTASCARSCGSRPTPAEIELETATVTGRDGFTVHTDRGELSAPLIVDALGWRRVLSTGRRSSRRTRGCRAVWRCTPPGAGEEMELWVDPRYIRAGYSLELSRAR